jgi:hypothetical protein
VGALVGWDVVGRCDGVNVGRKLGGKVRSTTGNAVGNSVGAYDGAWVGSGVGCTVGSEAGCCVGVAIGASVGTIDGPGVTRNHVWATVVAVRLEQSVNMWHAPASESVNAVQNPLNEIWAEQPRAHSSQACPIPPSV